MNIARTVVAAFLVAPFLLAQDNQGKNAADGAATKAPSVSIGVIDMVKAFEQYPRWIKLRAEHKKRTDAAEARLGELSKAIDEVRAALKIMGEDSEERRDGEVRLGLMEQERRETFKRLKEKLDLEEARAMIAVYEDLEVAIKKVAEARGVALVHRVHDTSDSPGEAAKLSPKAVDVRVRMFETKHIWYASPQVDLTPDVIKLLMVPLDDGKAAEKSAEKAAEKAAEAAPGANKDAGRAGGR